MVGLLFSKGCRSRGMTLAGDRIKLFAHRIIDPHPEQRGSTIARPADERLTKIAMRSSG